MPRTAPVGWVFFDRHREDGFTIRWQRSDSVAYVLEPTKGCKASEGRRSELLHPKEIVRSKEHELIFDAS